jgi:hypothetical protein
MTIYPIIPKKIGSYLSLLIVSFPVATKPKYTPYSSRWVFGQIFRLEKFLFLSIILFWKSPNIPKEDLFYLRPASARSVKVVQIG